MRSEMPVLSPHPISCVQITPSLQDSSQALFLSRIFSDPPRQRGPPPFPTAPSLTVSVTHSDAWLFSALLFELRGHASLLSPHPPTSGSGVTQTWSRVSALGLDGCELLDESWTSLSITYFICKNGHNFLFPAHPRVLL